MLRAKRIVESLVLMVVAGTVGCGTGVPEPNWAAPVACVGTVTFNGKPLSDVQVRFVPDVSTDGLGASALTDQSGKFKLASLSPRGEPIDGAVPGKYKVIFSRMVLPDGSPWTPSPDSQEGPATAGAREALPLKYSDPARSKFLIEVVAGGPAQTFALKK